MAGEAAEATIEFREAQHHRRVRMQGSSPRRGRMVPLSLTIDFARSSLAAGESSSGASASMRGRAVDWGHVRSRSTP
jgi:hypothetical protein